VWEASQALARVLVAQPTEFWDCNRRVVELGCGCGLCGIVAAGLGAHEVILTDQVLFVAQYNLQHAGLPPPARQRVRVEKLKWGVEEDAAAISPPFDLLLGGDIMYFPGHYKVLADTIIRLTAVGSEVALLVIIVRTRFPRFAALAAAAVAVSVAITYADFFEKAYRKDIETMVLTALTGLVRTVYSR
jgi:predicted nicotinamide N-methyase